MEACRFGGAKKAQQWTEDSETGSKKISRNEGKPGCDLVRTLHLEEVMDA
jgi:hypothetical protein